MVSSVALVALLVSTRTLLALPAAAVDESTIRFVNVYSGAKTVTLQTSSGKLKTVGSGAATGVFSVKTGVTIVAISESGKNLAKISVTRPSSLIILSGLAEPVVNVFTDERPIVEPTKSMIRLVNTIAEVDTTSILVAGRTVATAKSGAMSAYVPITPGKLEIELRAGDDPLDSKSATIGPSTLTTAVSFGGGDLGAGLLVLAPISASVPNPPSTRAPTTTKTVPATTSTTSITVQAPKASTPVSTRPTCQSHPEVVQISTGVVTANTPTTVIQRQNPKRFDLNIASLSIRGPVYESGPPTNGELTIGGPGETITDIVWYPRSAAPGDPGVALILGHINYAATLGPFYQIGKGHGPAIGATITIRKADGKQLTFVVTSVDTVKKSDLGIGPACDNSTAPELRIVTCGGSELVIGPDGKQHYSHNVIVSARLQATK
jgi:hypothetical protein